jgi:hypothetical protein
MNVRIAMVGAALGVIAVGARAADDDCQKPVADSITQEEKLKAAKAVLQLNVFCPEPASKELLQHCLDQSLLGFACCEASVENKLMEPELAVQAAKEGQKAATDSLADSDRLLHGMVTTPSVPGLVGSVSDFVNTGNLSALPIVRNLDDPYTLGAVFIPFTFKRGWFVLRAGVFFNPSPQINPVLKQRLINDGRTAQLGALDHTYGIEDDFSWQVEMSLRSAYLGRGFDEAGPTASALAAAMVEYETSAGNENINALNTAADPLSCPGRTRA